MDTTTNSTQATAPKQPKIKLVCLECGKKFAVSPNAADPQCPKCNSVDFDVVSL